MMGLGQTSPPGQFPVQPPMGQPPYGQMQQPGSQGGSSFTSPTGSPGAPPQVAQGFPPAIGGAQGPRPQSGHQQHTRNFSTGTMLSQSSVGQATQGTRHSSGQPASRFSGPISNPSQGPPQLGALPFQQQQQLQQQQQQQQQQPGPQQPQFQAPQFAHLQAHQRDSGGINPLMGNPTNPLGPPKPGMGAPMVGKQSPPPTQGLSQSSATQPAWPVFGVSLDKLYERDGLAVPMVVYQCIQAVDLFGLTVEGIYRQSGSMNSINKLKTLFDTGRRHSKDIWEKTR